MAADDPKNGQAPSDALPDATPNDAGDAASAPDAPPPDSALRDAAQDVAADAPPKVGLFKPPSAMEQLPKEVRDQIRKLNQFQLREQLAQELVQRFKVEQFARAQNGEVGRLMAVINGAKLAIARMLAHYVKDGVVAPDGFFAALEVAMPLANADGKPNHQIAVPPLDRFEVGWNGHDGNLRTPQGVPVFVVSLRRVDVPVRVPNEDAAAGGAAQGGGAGVGGGSSLLGPGGKPVGES